MFPENFVPKPFSSIISPKLILLSPLTLKVPFTLLWADFSIIALLHPSISAFTREPPWKSSRVDGEVIVFKSSNLIPVFSNCLKVEDVALADFKTSCVSSFHVETSASFI